MSLPNYLSKIKSAGIYRFVWDKSVVPPQQAETLRLVVGYSDKGPFNTPVYIESVSDFVSIYGNISKRLERKGVYFHRMAIQALQAGPILALNLKKFEASSTVATYAFDDYDSTAETPSKAVTGLYDQKRFWALDADSLPEKLSASGSNNCFYLTATDTKENSCSIIARKIEDNSYDKITIAQWYASQGEEMPENLSGIASEPLKDFFAEICVFKGKFDESLYGEGGSLSKYFTTGGVLRSSIESTFGTISDVLEALTRDSKSNFIGSYKGCILPYFKDANGNYISLDIKFNAGYNDHKMLMKIDETFEFKKEDDAVNVSFPTQDLKPQYFEGYTWSVPTGTYWDACKSMLTSLHEPLTNKVDVEYHYIVDTFDTETSNSKVELFGLAKDKDNAFAIVNFPKMSKFADMDAVKAFPMPGDVEGASWGAYYTQLTFSDGTVKSVIPSAALVSNLFMDKWGARQPYYIVAGPTYGRLSYSGLVGPDYNFGRSDLDVLEPMGVNAIVYVPRLGTYINSNQTAKQAPVSGLSKIHVRELVIFLQNEVEYLLQSYQWELNTQTLRDTIKSKADSICETIMNNGGIYAFRNVCDHTNNTPEVIDNEMIVLDTEIEPARGAGKMIHQLTIHKTGGLTSSVK